MEKTTYYGQECRSAQYVCIGKNELIQYKRKCSEWIETTYASQTESLGKQRFGALFICSRLHTSLHLKSEAKVSDFFMNISGPASLII